MPFLQAKHRFLSHWIVTFLPLGDLKDWFVAVLQLQNDRVGARRAKPCGHGGSRPSVINLGG